MTAAPHAQRGTAGLGTNSTARVADVTKRQQRTIGRLADPNEVLEARATARAYLIADGEIENPIAYFSDLCCDIAQQVHARQLDLGVAVDQLQSCAARAGLISTYGQDDVQFWMAEAFAMRCELRMAA